MSGSHRDSEHAGLHAHRKAAPGRIPSAVLTVSDTRTLETDTGGALLAERLEAAGHPVVLRDIVPDDLSAIQAAVRRVLERDDVGALLVTGGTGIAARDVTPEAIGPLLEREVPGFGELFRMLSYEEIGSAALLSRALAGLAQGRVVFVLPGSRGALRLALDKLILPELAHLVGEARKGV